MTTTKRDQRDRPPLPPRRASSNRDRICHDRSRHRRRHRRPRSTRSGTRSERCTQTISTAMRNRSTAASRRPAIQSSSSASARRALRRTRLAAAAAGFHAAPSPTARQSRSRAQSSVRIGETFRINFRHPQQRRAPQRRAPALDQRIGGAHAAQIAHQIERVSHSARSPGRYRPPATRSRRAAATHRDRATSAKGATRGETPPSISASAAANDWRNSVSVSPPSKARKEQPSGFSARRICISVPGKSLTNCSASAETTRSSEPSANGRRSSSRQSAAFHRARLARQWIDRDDLRRQSLRPQHARNASRACRCRPRRSNVRFTADSRSTSSLRDMVEQKSRPARRASRAPTPAQHVTIEDEGRSGHFHTSPDGASWPLVGPECMSGTL